MDDGPEQSAWAGGRPLIVAEDGELLEDLLRIAAAAGAEPDVAAEPGAALSRAWVRAPLVVLSAGTARQCVAARVPRRDGLILVADPGDADQVEVWELATALGAGHVVVLPAAASWLAERFADCAVVPHSSAAVVAVAGARGGAGATVLAAALGVAAARRGIGALLVDGDPLGGGIDLVLGQEGGTGLRWPDLAGTSGRVSPDALAALLPRSGSLSMLSWDRGEVQAVPPSAMTAVLRAGRRGGGIVIVDLPRHLDEAARFAAAEADLTLLIVPAEVRAVAAAARMAEVLRPHSADVRLVVRGPAPSGLRGRDVASALGLPLLATLRAEPGLAAALERGEPPAGDRRGPLAQLCAVVLNQLLVAERVSAA